MTTQADQGATSGRGGVFARRIAWLLALQLLVTVLACVLAAKAPHLLPLALVAVTAAAVLAWLAARSVWQPVRELARLLRDWDDDEAGLSALRSAPVTRARDVDLLDLTRGVHGFAERIADYGRRERNFTRDASHELRTPLTVIRMAVDRLNDDVGLDESGRRSVDRIHRATRELEALVEVLLILAREAEPGCVAEHFVVNEVLRRELEAARDQLAGSDIELALEEPASFALHDSARAFSVLCWQLIRDACQRAGSGRVLITVHPAAITVSHEARVAAAAPASGHQSSFELAIAQRISDRFAWPLELHAEPGQPGLARVHFPQVRRAEAARAEA